MTLLATAEQHQNKQTEKPHRLVYSNVTPIQFDFCLNRLSVPKITKSFVYAQHLIASNLLHKNCCTFVLFLSLILHVDGDLPSFCTNEIVLFAFHIQSAPSFDAQFTTNALILLYGNFLKEAINALKLLPNFDFLRQKERHIERERDRPQYYTISLEVISFVCFDLCSLKKCSMKIWFHICFDL